MNFYVAGPRGALTWGPVDFFGGFLGLSVSSVYAQAMSLRRQFATFIVVGLGAFVAHYGVLIWLVEAWAWTPVPATLVGYVAGGLVSYALNRRHTYASDRPHAEAGWRFALVAGVGFVLTTASMYAMTRWAGLHYLFAQVLTTALVLCWSFVAHRVWTFAQKG